MKRLSLFSSRVILSQPHINPLSEHIEINVTLYKTNPLVITLEKTRKSSIKCLVTTGVIKGSSWERLYKGVP